MAKGKSKPKLVAVGETDKHLVINLGIAKCYFLKTAWNRIKVKGG